MFKRAAEFVTSAVDMVVDAVYPPTPQPVSDQDMTMVGSLLFAPTGGINEHLYLTDAVRRMQSQELLERLSNATSRREAQVFREALGPQTSLRVLRRDGVPSPRRIRLYSKMADELRTWDEQDQPLPAPRWIRLITEKATGVALTHFGTRSIVDTGVYWHTDIDDEAEGEVFAIVDHDSWPEPIPLSTLILRYK